MTKNVTEINFIETEKDGIGKAEVPNTELDRAAIYYLTSVDENGQSSYIDVNVEHLKNAKVGDKFQSPGHLEPEQAVLNIMEIKEDGTQIHVIEQNVERERERSGNVSSASFL